MFEKIQAWLEDLEERERRLVIAGAIFLAFFIPFQFIWTPFTNSIEELETQVQEQQEDLLWMKNHINEVRQLSISANTRGNNRAIYGVVERSARQKFGDRIRVKQEANGVRVEITESRFDDIIIWLDDLYFRNKVNIIDFRINRENEQGIVSARILLGA
jgi:type II secretory pathway component PulM